MTQNKTTKVFAALALTAFIAGYGQAATFQSKGTLTKKAVANLSSAGTISLNSLTVKSIAGNGTVTDVTWTDPVIGNWAIADTYLVLDATSTSTGSGVQIWTDNLNGVAPYKSTLTAAERVTTTPGGLVDEHNGKKSLPIAWAVKQTLNPAFTAADPNASPTSFPDASAWHYAPDKGSLDNPATTTLDELYKDGADYQTVQNTAGIHFGQAPTEYGAASNPKVMYLEANFALASTPNTYGTTTLTVEAFQQ